uniref:Nudix hydrolase domain-containing protein n=1 Tax=Parascaris univalens TaxID=6257 RepID=A0A915BVA7_PARUN
MQQSETQNDKQRRIDAIMDGYRGGSIGSLAELRDTIERETGVNYSVSYWQRKLLGTRPQGRRRKEKKSDEDGAEKRLRLSDSSIHGRTHTLSRNLKETILTVEEGEGVRQYARMHISENGRKVYYRCNKCVKFLRRGAGGRAATIKTIDGEIFGEAHPTHVEGCELMRKEDVFVAEIVRECRRDVRRGIKTPRMAHTDGFVRVLSAENELSKADRSGDGQGFMVRYPRWESIKRSLNRHRRLSAIRASSPFELPDQDDEKSTVTTSNERSTTPEKHGTLIYLWKQNSHHSWDSANRAEYSRNIAVSEPRSRFCGFTSDLGKPMTSNTYEEEFLSDVRINENPLGFPYDRLMQITFRRGDEEMKWDMALRPDSVACILFHRDMDSLLFVKQFRPAVFVSTVRRMAENYGKENADIDWNKYPISIGETLELCAGAISKPELSEFAHMREKIIEQCGYDVKECDITFLRKFITGMGASGAHQLLFYAEIDETMRVDGDDGTRRGHIEKIFMTLPEAEEYYDQKDIPSAPSLLYALQWFFNQLRQ